jgi:hypothetical protein
MKAPQSRYKIIERDRRLVTIDTKTGLEVGLGGQPAFEMPRAPEPERALPTATDRVAAPERPSALRPQRAATRKSATTLRIVGGFFPGVTLTSGDLYLTTRRSYDAQGPRTLRLTDARADLLGRFGLVIGVIGIIVLAIAVAADFWVVLFVAAVFGFRFAKGVYRATMKQAMIGATPMDQSATG